MLDVIIIITVNEIICAITTNKIRVDIYIAILVVLWIYYGCTEVRRLDLTKVIDVAVWSRDVVVSKVGII